MERRTMYFETVNSTKLEKEVFDELTFESIKSDKVGYCDKPHIVLLGKDTDVGHNILGVIPFSTKERMLVASEHLEKFLDLVSEEIELLEE